MNAQNIADFTSVNPLVQTEQFVIPSSHAFQKIIEVDDALSEGGLMERNPDFTGFIPILNSSTNGYLSINSEKVPGTAAIFDINFNAKKNWMNRKTNSRYNTKNFKGIIQFNFIIIMIYY